MKLPRLKEIQFSPLMWKECIVKGSTWETVQEFYSYFREQAQAVEWCKGIEVDVADRQIRSLVNGYAIFDFLEWCGMIQLEFKMWQLFEDLVGEILRKSLKDKDECAVVHVDRLPGFRGLDFVVTNSKKKEGWKVGVQCKRYIGSVIPKCRLEEYGSWSRGTSAEQLRIKGVELHRNFQEKSLFWRLSTLLGKQQYKNKDLRN